MREVLLFVCLLMAGMTVNVNAAKQKAKHVILIGMDGWGLTVSLKRISRLSKV